MNGSLYARRKYAIDEEDCNQTNCPYACEACLKLICKNCFDNRHSVGQCCPDSNYKNYHLVKSIDFVTRQVDEKLQQLSPACIRQKRDIILEHLNRLKAAYSLEQSDNLRTMNRLTGGCAGMGQQREAVAALRQHMKENEEQKSSQVTQLQCAWKIVDDLIGSMFEQYWSSTKQCRIKNYRRLQEVLGESCYNSTNLRQKYPQPKKWSNSVYMVGRCLNNFCM